MLSEENGGLVEAMKNLIKTSKSMEKEMAAYKVTKVCSHALQAIQNSVIVRSHVV